MNLKNKKMSSIQVKDKLFELSIKEEVILEAIDKIAKAMNEDLGDKNPLFICVLNGGFMFASDLLKRLNFPCEISFIRLQSYQKSSTNGQIKEIYGLQGNIENRNVVILEDIIDTGYTMSFLKKELLSKKPNMLKVATLLFKPKALSVELEPDYVALEISNEFIVGYGLDYDGHGRNLRDIYKIKES
ncbi:hypoxanthine phosphoribosyltransferase [Bacteroidales bacterium]|nr:hypoxanthine phosphoribosyltransferase [Bacteroidales bacterium]